MRAIILILIGYVLRMLIETARWEYLVKPNIVIHHKKVTDPEEIKKILEELKRSDDDTKGN